MTTIANIAIATPLYQSFDYLWPDHLAMPAVGARVKVPFGRRELIGVVLELKHSSDYPAAKLKSAILLLDEQPLYDAKLWTLLLWLADFYQAPIGEVIVGLLPKFFRQGRDVEVGQITNAQASEQGHALSSAQQAAKEAVLAGQGFAPYLLNGVTGSGKTEVYLNIIAATLAKGQQALVLVPEIGLTPQLLKRFTSRLSANIALLHSGLTDKKRWQAWNAVRLGEAHVVIGTRSAVLTPMKHLGVIIVDESHDLSFKQLSGVRYQARDVAIKRAQLENIAIVLGSATPSLESFYNVSKGRYLQLSLPTRAGHAKPPLVTLLNMRDQHLSAGMCPQLVSAIKEALSHNKQIMLFLNRRGYAPAFLCHACGWMASCHRCDSKLTFHKAWQKLICHHCDAVKPVPQQCPSCGGQQLLPVGAGTEQLEQSLMAMFPDKNIVRVDRDNTRRKGELEKILKQATDGDIDILIGTQMLAKGHHFPNLTMVAVIDADSALYSQDFRATEHLGQLLLQVAGRAGREQTLGEVFIQTHFTDHPLFKLLFSQGYAALAQSLLKERELAKLPPYCYRSMIHAEAHTKAVVTDFLTAIKAKLHTHQEDDVFGPWQIGMEKLAGKYRSQLIIQSQTRKQMHQYLLDVVHYATNHQLAKKVKWLIDVDSAS